MLVHMCNELLEIHINTNQKERLVVWAWSILVRYNWNIVESGIKHHTSDHISTIYLMYFEWILNFDGRSKLDKYHQTKNPENFSKECIVNKDIIV
jgi:hypothetical protein